MRGTGLTSWPGKGQVCTCAKLFQLWLTLWTVHPQAPLSTRILQARIWEWVDMPSSRGSSWSRDQSYISYLQHRQVGSEPLAQVGKPKDRWPPANPALLISACLESNKEEMPEEGGGKQTWTQRCSLLGYVREVLYRAGGLEVQRWKLLLLHRLSAKRDQVQGLDFGLWYQTGWGSNPFTSFPAG